MIEHTHAVEWYDETTGCWYKADEYETRGEAERKVADEIDDCNARGISMRFRIVSTSTEVVGSDAWNAQYGSPVGG